MILFWTYVLLVVTCVYSKRPIDRYNPFWASPPLPNIPQMPSMPGGGNFKRPGGAFTGNGDIGVVFAADKNPSSKYRYYLSGSQSLLFGKNDFWMSDSTSYFAHLSAAKLNISLPAGVYSGNITQTMSQATLITAMNSSNMSLSSSTIVGENNVVLTTLRCGSGSNCSIVLALGDTTHNHYGLTERSGGDAASASIWFRKENLHSYNNPAYLGSCDPGRLLYSTQRKFVIHGNGSLTMANSSCLWVIRPDRLNTTNFATGDCTKSQGRWIWRPVNGTYRNLQEEVARGDVVFQGLHKENNNRNSMHDETQVELCLDPHGGKQPLSLSPSCGSGSWIINATTSYLQVATTARCLVVVPDNSNNTLGAAVTVIDTAGNPVKSKIMPVNSSDPSSGMSLMTTLKAGEEYIVMTALLTLRDLGCAGTWSDTQQCTVAPEVEALNLLQKMAHVSARQALIAEHDLFWSSWWNASSIDLVGGSLEAPAEVVTLERWYYSMQYALGVTTRQGKIAPSLIGNLVVVEPVAWSDQLTLDYNFEATFWGAGSSNRIESYKPYIATVTNPAAVAVARARATNPGVWTHHAGKMTPVGQVVGIGDCDSSSRWSNMGWCPNLSQGKGFRGTSWPDTGFPLGDGRLSFTDGQTRFTGALMATDLIQYFEFSRDEVTLNETIYPFIKDNVDFYMSYVRKDNHSNIFFPYSCAQEGCSCRNSVEKWPWRWGDHRMIPAPNDTSICKDPSGPGGFTCTGSFYNTGFGEHDAHADIAFAKQSVRKVIEYSELLGVDSHLRPGWKSFLENLPAYPTVALKFRPGTIGSELNGQTLFVEARTGHEADMVLNTSEPGGSGQIWPWCNVEYPIGNFAAIWPTNDIGTVQTASDPKLLATAKSTIWALNNYTGYVFAGTRTPWANENGFCLSWPPAVRVSTQSDAVDLLDKFKVALDKTMGQNGLISLGGGNLENIGATVAVNDMLLQGHAGQLRFFPVWNGKTLGPASFQSLRAYGAFLVSAAVDSAGVVSPVKVVSLKGMLCVFESPWKGMKPNVTSNGIPQSVSSVSGKIGVFSFPTRLDYEYIITQATKQSVDGIVG